MCGALNWFAPSLLDYVDRRDNESAKQVIRRYVKELDSRMKDCDFSEDTCRFFVNGLQFSLAAYGAVLWSAQTAVLRIPLPTPFKKLHAGQSDTPAFAAEIISTGVASQCTAKVDGTPCLLLGAPMITRGRVTGVIEVIQREAESDTIRAHMKFLTRIAAIAAPLSL